MCGCRAPRRRRIASLRLHVVGLSLDAEGTRLVVVLSFGVAGYAALILMRPAFSLGDELATLLGIAMIIAVAVTTIFAFKRHRQQQQRFSAHE